MSTRLLRLICGLFRLNYETTNFYRNYDNNSDDNGDFLQQNSWRE